MRLRQVWALSVLVWATGCSSDEGRLLVVELATDLTSGVDFVGVRVEVRSGDAVVAQMSELAPRGRSFVTPQRVAPFEGLADGTYDIDTAVLDLDGAAVAARRTVTDDAQAATADEPQAGDYGES